jgi:DNA-binding transcriptional LysR family regulator
MELYQLRTFLTVAEEGHLTRAAEKLFTSQPAVSGQIRALEEELGMKLFERTSRGMQLTQAGKTLCEQARRVVDAARDFKHSADGLRGAVSGELVLGLNNRPEILRLMEVLQELTARHADLSYELVNGSSGVITQGLEEGSISIGFFEGQCESSKITFHELDTIELCLAAPAEWAEELSLPDWKALESKPWIFVSPMCSYFRTIQHICREQGLQIDPRFRVNEELTVLNLVAEGLGVTLLAKRQIELHQFEGRVVPLPHFRAVVPLCLGYLTDRANDPAIMAVRDTVLDVWGKPMESEVPATRSKSMPSVPPFRCDTRAPATGTTSSTNLRRQ